MSTRRIPIASRWALYALGTVDSDRIRLPADPVAAWLLKRAPQLLPVQSVPTVLTMIRCRTRVLDRMIREEVDWARCQDQKVDFWSLGAGFDARWYRVRPWTKGVVDRFIELDEPDVARTKAELLSESTFADQWHQVQVQGLPVEQWTVRGSGRQPLVVLEGVSTRVTPEVLKQLLIRIRKDAPDAHVVLDLPSFVSMIHSQAEAPRGASGAELDVVGIANPYRWGRGMFRGMGWEMVEDVWLTARPTLRNPTGPGVCPGMEALRLVRLRPA